ncbi:polysaccharide biosynthesis protein [Paenibacillus filicis]|uniref:Polysaccharide biosynthesis protein n=1 Tax=Paenibacillus gyeongsangnamensis TaxID=3388067 RepID=A0ABT4QL03_9BACL|nr:polysaccharide biosynthesis protein [Paenibacillus filicis]MCZ8517553.1 polysaccharide biosynthesis protein [Paenibacillus filicis]
MKTHADKHRPEQGKATGSALLKGAAILAAAAVVSKLIGTLQKIPLQNMAGDTVFGIYNAVYPLYILILFLATAGFPLVVSKFVSEHAAAGNRREANRVLQVATVVLLATGMVFFLMLYFGADRIGDWMGLPQTKPAIRSVSFALLVVPAMSALRGYYQGYQDMLPTAWSQVWEQTFRVATMFGLLLLFMRLGLGPDRIAAGATFGSVTGAVAGLIVMLGYRRREKRREAAEAGAARSEADAGPSRAVEPVPPADTPAAMGEWRVNIALARRLAAYALPLCLGSIALPILTLTDSFTIPRLLLQSGYDEKGALYQFGLYNHGLPMVQLVAMIASSMSAALVPAIAEARLRREREALRARSGQSLRLTWLLALPASFGLALLAEPMNVMFFKTAEGTTAVAILAFTALFSAVNSIASSVLQGFGAVRAPAVYLLLAAAAKAAGNAVLVPSYGITGAAAAAVAAYALAGGLALAHALRATGVTAAGGLRVMKAIYAIAFMTACLLAVTHGVPPILARLGAALPPRGMAALVTLVGVAAGALAYALALLRLGVITAAELALVPQLRGRPLALLKKLRLLR